MAARFPRVCRQTRSNGSVSLFVNVRVSPLGTPPRYERRYIGTEGSPEALRNLADLQDEFARNNGYIKPRPRPTDKPSVALLCSRFMEFARQDYPARSKEPEHYARVLTLLVKFCGTIPAENFGLERAEAFRRSLLAAGTCCRKEINSRVRRVMRVFRWGARYKIVPVNLLTELSLLETLRVGKGGSHDNPPVRPVPVADVIKTLPLLPGPVAALVRLQLLTGARPGELRIMRPRDIHTDVRNGCWRYYPEHDKTERFRPVGVKKCIPLNAAAQNVLRPFLAEKQPDDYLFSPADTVAAQRAQRAADRKTKKTPSQAARDLERKRHPRERFDPFYSASAYRIAVQRAAKKAGVPSWHPYQLRHTAATELQKAHGIEAAQILLGHRSVTTTAIYVEQDTSQAEKIANYMTRFGQTEL